MAGFTACTDDNSYNIYDNGSETVHPVATVVVYDEATSGFTTQDRIQCGSVKLGGNCVFN